jgi:type III restriction enzyme
LLMDADYREYLARDTADQVHEGYFSMDKNKRLKDPKEIARGERAGETDDESAYDLILKNKGRLLSIAEPVRFIFSHSALREGWDNPNVFQICTLKQSNNEISRRQEVGRGLRICVNAQGDRMDDPAIVHDINVLTVIASESYEDFVKGFQDETAKSLHARPRKANSEYFEDKIFQMDDGSSVPVSNQMARDIERYLIKNDYTDNSDHITDGYHTSKEAGVLAELPDTLQPYAAQVFALIDSVFDKNALPDIGNDFKTQTNNLAQANFDKKEFQSLWKAINRKAVYTVNFDTDELIENCVRTLDIELKVAQLSYGVKGATQKATLTQSDIDRGGSMFGGEMREDQIPYNAAPTSTVKYDLIGELAQKCELTRKTIGKILSQINPKTFAMFALNPEMFISGAAKIIIDKKGSTIVS